MSVVNKKSKILFLTMLLVILGTRYVYIINEENSVNRVLVTYGSNFQSANILNEIDSAASEMESTKDILKEIEAEEERKKLEEQKKKQNVVSLSYSSDTNTNGSLATQIVNYALQFVGNPYVYGGNSLTNGTDCSGFTSLVFANFGISLPRTAPAQAYVGRAVSISDIQPGDLVLHGYDGVVIHAALYIGNNQVVHALNSNTGIVVTNYQIMPIVSVRRVL